MTDAPIPRFLPVSNDFSGDVLYPDEMEALGYDQATILSAWPGWRRGEDGYWHMPRPDPIPPNPYPSPAGEGCAALIAFAITAGVLWAWHHFHWFGFL